MQPPLLSYPTTQADASARRASCRSSCPGMRRAALTLTTPSPPPTAPQPLPRPLQLKTPRLARLPVVPHRQQGSSPRHLAPHWPTLLPWRRPGRLLPQAASPLPPATAAPPPACCPPARQSAWTRMRAPPPTHCRQVGGWGAAGAGACSRGWGCYLTALCPQPLASVHAVGVTALLLICALHSLTASQASWHRSWASRVPPPPATPPPTTAQTPRRCPAATGARVSGVGLPVWRWPAEANV